MNSKASLSCIIIQDAFRHSNENWFDCILFLDICHPVISSSKHLWVIKILITQDNTRKYLACISIVTLIYTCTVCRVKFYPVLWDLHLYFILGFNKDVSNVLSFSIDAALGIRRNMFYHINDVPTLYSSKDFIQTDIQYYLIPFDI